MSGAETTTSTPSGAVTSPMATTRVTPRRANSAARAEAVGAAEGVALPGSGLPGVGLPVVPVAALSSAEPTSSGTPHAMLTCAARSLERATSSTSTTSGADVNSAALAARASAASATGPSGAAVRVRGASCRKPSGPDASGVQALSSGITASPPTTTLRRESPRLCGTGRDDEGMADLSSRSPGGLARAWLLPSTIPGLGPRARRPAPRGRTRRAASAVRGGAPIAHAERGSRAAAPLPLPPLRLRPCGEPSRGSPRARRGSGARHRPGGPARPATTRSAA
ncbi:hypothetical protein ACH61_02543 [Rathayibacter tanaceti]|uniref:Uncharacterized protein n=1 Tax=Rathayibacter tanaceti TaxID=1671680 RepID=A0A166HC39_9MICO|nr:hypothetical protein ACH61_02543 [Rathayibacter tanaceti]